MCGCSRFAGTNDVLERTLGMRSIGIPIGNHDNNRHNFDENPASRTCGLVSS